jgi:rhodanese-related sulfurtransferase
MTLIRTDRRRQWGVGRLFDAALALGVVVVLTRLFLGEPNLRSTGTVAIDDLRVGSVLQLTKKALGSANRHVVLFLSATCPISELESPRYGPLADLIGGVDGTGLVVVVPDRLSEAKQWLDARGIRASRTVRVLRPDLIGIQAYPTVVIVDATHVVTDILIGASSESDWLQLEARILGRTVAPLGAEAAVEVISIREFLNRRDVGAQLVDVRERQEYGRSHQLGAINIPLDELAIRAPIELVGSSPVALDCTSGLMVSDCRLYASGLRRLGFASVTVVAPER